MSGSVDMPSTRNGNATSDAAPDWASLYPADPEIMVSAEGDARGLADVRRVAQQRIERGREG